MRRAKPYLGLGQQRAPVFVELQTPADAIKQFDAQRGLELRQGGAGRRLRARDAIGRRTCAAAARRGQKDLQLTQVQAQALERRLIGFIDHYERYYLIFYFMTYAYYQIHERKFD